MTAILLALTARYLVLPEYRPPLKPGEAYGIDVSSHQKSIDWGKVSKDHISFVYIKATEGSGTRDDKYRSYQSGARQVGLKTGAYHYFSLCSPGATQADNFSNTTATSPLALRPALDLEFSPYCKQKPGRSAVVQEIRTYLDQLRRAGRKEPMLYVGSSFEATYHIRQAFPDYDYWQLRYLQRTEDNISRMWQAGNFYHVDGIKGGVDINLANVHKL